LEVNLSFKGEVSFISMAKATLGIPGEISAWLGLLLLLYALLAAYLVGSGPLFLEGINEVMGTSIPSVYGPAPILILFAPLVYFGIRLVDLVNRYLMVGLIAAYVLMVALLLPKVDMSLLAYSDSEYALVSFAVLVTAFGYHIIIPTLTSYLDRNISQIKACILIGSFIPMLVYMLWELVILGTIPVGGAHGIASALANEMSLSYVLQELLGSRVISSATRMFAIFAIVTSFLGVAQSLFDLLKDGLALGNRRGAQALVWILTFVPPTLIVVLSGSGFVAVLEYAGVFVAVLIGLMPIGMAWSARYVKKLPSPYRAFGGKPVLVLGALAFVGMIVLSLGKNFGLLG